MKTSRRKASSRHPQSKWRISGTRLGVQERGFTPARPLVKAVSRLTSADESVRLPKIVLLSRGTSRLTINSEGACLDCVEVLKILRSFPATNGGPGSTGVSRFRRLARLPLSSPLADSKLSANQIYADKFAEAVSDSPHCGAGRLDDLLPAGGYGVGGIAEPLAPVRLSGINTSTLVNPRERGMNELPTLRDRISKHRNRNGGQRI
jgi:hypothetical protein